MSVQQKSYSTGAFSILGTLEEAAGTTITQFYSSGNVKIQATGTGLLDESKAAFKMKEGIIECTSFSELDSF